VSIQFGGTWLNSTSNFTYTSPPNVTAFSPVNSIAAGGAVVTFTGTNLGSSANKLVILFGGSPFCTILTHTATSVTCQVGPFAAGTSGPIAFTLDSAPIMLPLQNFTVLANPVASSFSPAMAPLSGGITLTITGSGFTNRPPPTVAIGLASCIVNTFSNTSIQCQLGVSPTPGSGLSVAVVEDFNFFNVTGATFAVGDNPTITSFSPAVRTPIFFLSFFLS